MCISDRFQAHNWPHWGNQEVNEILEETAAVYKFINDQTLLYMNKGLTPNEISQMCIRDRTCSA